VGGQRGEKEMEAFLATLEPMARGKARQALERQMRLSGRTMFRWQAAEELAANPSVRIDETKGRLYTSEKVFYEIKDLTKTLVEFVRFIQGVTQ
jgi:hypothetical protein